VAELPSVEGYRVVEELGSGSLASVYKAIEEPLGRVVALKVLRATISPGSAFAGQLEREARVLSELCHPNVGLLYGFSKTETRMALVLEFVDGHSLASVLKRGRSVPPDSVAAIGAAVARGLAHAHDRGIVHRDIKPASILLSRRGEVKIFDFGIALAPREAADLSPVRLEDRSAFGTAAYMSPEQILGEGIDARSDIFSLGVVLYELLCGARPFERGDEVDRRPIAHQIRRDPPIALHRRAPDVPAALERVVMHAIEKLPADRFASAEAMAERLEELAAGRSGLRADRLVVRALVVAGLTPASEPESTELPRRPKKTSVRRSIAGIAVLGATAVAGGGALEATAHREGLAAGARPLELAPAKPGYLRVLATPWAEVWVDGQRVEVTPFARGIPLPPGTHYVTLVHPTAPVEKRTVSIVSDDTRTIDVIMSLPEPPPEADAETSVRTEREPP
jgi:eukaryotic-like serine/threonine-protein kinase